ncbi:hypothetical protein KIP88_07305 [Bradyrhizobium sp. SRL28]|uniref:hypothetical protein n=1 Tax=Bradyrhizobium sp. SRL28 TaxID=2836178 RepID=UPI001BDEE1D3|nr:hypothetical protein [Bradyrhizobium sp. SRL28]MBT1510307.1 hypothetical protein [Bradyrhizobium sp. SRL28]
MIVDRRVFVAGAAVAAVAPAFRMLPAKAAVPETAAIQQPAFMISGWSAEDGSVDNQVWLRVGLGWRTAWR